MILIVIRWILSTIYKTRICLYRFEVLIGGYTMSILRYLFKYSGNKTKLLYILILIAFYKLCFYIPLISIESPNVHTDFEFLGMNFRFFNAFLGNSLSSFSIVSLGVLPVLTAIILLLIFERLKKTPDQKIYKNILKNKNRLSIVLSLLFAIIFIITIQDSILGKLSWYQYVFITVKMMSGTAIVILLIEEIENLALFSGLKLIVIVNILTGLASHYNPEYIYKYCVSNGVWGIILFIVTVIVIIFIYLGLTLSQRRIPTQYASLHHARSLKLRNARKSTSATYIPINLNEVGEYLESGVVLYGLIAALLYALLNLFFKQPIALGGWSKTTGEILMYLCVALFMYAASIANFEDKNMAQSLVQHGGYIPEIRSDRHHIAQYLQQTKKRITSFSILIIVALFALPRIVFNSIKIDNYLDTIMIMLLLNNVSDIQKTIAAKVAYRRESFFR